jgi:hypothetical protein
MNTEETMNLAERLEQAFADTDTPIATTAIIQGDSIGFPLRITDPENQNLDGEPEGFDAAYDLAQDILGGAVSTTREGGYVWFTKRESE